MVRHIDIDWESKDAQTALAAARDALIAREARDSIRRPIRAAGEVAQTAAERRLGVAVRKLATFHGGRTYEADLRRFVRVARAVKVEAVRRLDAERKAERAADRAEPVTA
jgi:hypothetical protein